MLTQITISQFTVVDTLNVEFEGGLTVLTGETGAGKSIILDALGLCLGDRADPAAIRPGSDRAEICATFDVGDIPAARRWIAERELDTSSDGKDGRVECILRRTLSREGRSRAYINGRPATLDDCASLGQLLIDIHGQHAHQSLLRRAFQRELLDSYGGLSAQAATVDDLAREWKALAERIAALRSSQRERADREQLLRYQVGELEELALGAGESALLEEEQRRLANADTIQRDAAAAIELCEQNESGVRAALRALDPKLHTGEAMAGVRDMLDSAAIQLSEARAELERYASSCEGDPARLAEVEARLDAVYSLARKHRVAPEALVEHFFALGAELEALDSSDERLAELDSELRELADAYGTAAAALSKARATAAQRLEREVAKLLGKLSMGNCRFRVALTPRNDSRPHPNGSEEAELLVATNPGAEPQALSRIASGGELSRISLAIQVATAGKARVPSMVFDEVDVGIGGAVAEVVGRLLAEMAREAQVLCVTHLPQVAAQGQHHLRVVKIGRGKSVASELEPLGQEERIQEIARMLGGVKITESTLAHAREMLALAG
jgi:DNA repair protein RecN (Recombination protein N)